VSFSPRTRFIIQLVVFVCVGISQGTVHLTHMIPDGWIPTALAWAGFIAFLGTGFTTLLSGFGMTTQSRIDAAASLPEVKQIVADKPVADAAPSDKVVSKP
jgi:tetrahydromethanopterin S-methyltransferase subunit D